MKKFKKLTVIAHKSDFKELIFSLMRLRCVALADISAEYGAFYGTQGADSSEKTALEGNIERIEKAIEMLSAGEKKSSKAPKIDADMDKFLSEKLDERAYFAVSQTLAAEERKKEIAAEIAEIEILAQKCEPYINYELPLGLKKTKRTSVIFGFFPPRTELSAVGKRLYGAGAVADNFKTDRTGVYVSVFCHETDDEKVREVLSEFGFITADFDEKTGTAPIAHGEYMRKIAALKEEAAQLSDKIKAVWAGISAIKILLDIEKSRLNFLSYAEKIGKSSESALFEGYFPAPEEERVITALGYFDCAYSAEDTDKSESPLYIKKLVFADDEKSLEKIKTLQEKNTNIFLPMVMSDIYSDLAAKV